MRSVTGALGDLPLRRGFGKGGCAPTPWVWAIGDQMRTAEFFSSSMLDDVYSAINMRLQHAIKMAVPCCALPTWAAPLIGMNALGFIGDPFRLCHYSSPSFDTG